MQHHDIEQKCSCFGAIVLSTNEIWRWATGCSLSSTARNGTKQSALTTQRAIHIQIIQIIQIIQDGFDERESADLRLSWVLPR
jgi:hypothetical protein